MNLIIDIGNTTAKVALFDGNEMVEVVTDSNQSLDCLKALCSKYPVEQGIVATVIDLSERILADLAALPFPLLWLNHQTPLPVANLYETPDTLGYDRMAAVVGANERFPHNDILMRALASLMSLSTRRGSITVVIFLPACRCASRHFISLPGVCHR